jgi:hypothetical protein
MRNASPDRQTGGQSRVTRLALVVLGVVLLLAALPFLFMGSMMAGMMGSMMGGGMGMGWGTLVVGLSLGALGVALLVLGLRAR